MATVVTQEAKLTAGPDFTDTYPVNATPPAPAEACSSLGYEGDDDGDVIGVDDRGEWSCDGPNPLWKVAGAVLAVVVGIVWGPDIAAHLLAAAP